MKGNLIRFASIPQMSKIGQQSLQPDDFPVQCPPAAKRGGIVNVDH